jgi:deoxyribonuclease V
MDVKRLYDEQTKLGKRAILTDSFGPIKRVGGVDCSYLGDEHIIAGLVVLDYETLKPIYRTFEKQRLTFPYIPGLLAYREADAMMAVIGKAKVKPDIVLVDGFGTNHPRRCGIATHIGIKLDMPTIGVGKSFLCGETCDDGYICQAGEKVGKMIYSAGSKRPVYVSPGHKISLDTAVEIVSHCIKTGRQPEPTRLAHEYVSGLMRAKAETKKHKL